MHDHHVTHAQEQQERKARRMISTLVAVQTFGGIMGASTVLWITGTWPFTFEFLVGYTFTAICIVLMLIGAIFLRFRLRHRTQHTAEVFILVTSDPPNQDNLTEFDRLVEQQEQEIALYGEVSPFTRLQLEAYAEGKPVPHVSVHSPELERLTRELLRGKQQVRRWRLPTDDDDYWDWEAEAEDEAEL